MSYPELHEKLTKILKQAKDLPTLPSVASNALQLMGNPRTSMKDLGTAIGSDQAITSKLLRMVNSAYYGFPRKISTISQALVVIGVEGLRSLIMGLSVQSMFNSKEGKILWEHSVTTAAAAKIITQKFGNVHPEESFVVGLIHDVGRLVICQNFPDEFNYFKLIEMDSLQTLSKERDIFGLDHSEIGFNIATKWNLPDKIVDSIKYHHKPNLAPQNQVCLIVCIAESIALFVQELSKNPQLEEDDIYNFITPEYLERLKIKEIPAQMIEDVISKTKELMEIFGKN